MRCCCYNMSDVLLIYVAASIADSAQTVAKVSFLSDLIIMQGEKTVNICSSFILWNKTKKTNLKYGIQEKGAVAPGADHSRHNGSVVNPFLFHFSHRG